MNVISRMRLAFNETPVNWLNHNDLKFYVSMNPIGKLEVRSVRHEMCYGVFTSNYSVAQKFIDENEQELLEWFEAEKIAMLKENINNKVFMIQMKTRLNASDRAELERLMNIIKECDESK